MAKKAAYGTILSVQYGQTGSYIDLINLADISGPEEAIETIDVTTHDSPDHYNEFLPGMADGGEVAFEVQFDASNAAHETLQNAVSARLLHNFYLKLPGWTSTGTGGYWSFVGLFTKFSPSLAVKGSVTASMSVKVSGRPVFHKFTT